MSTLEMKIAIPEVKGGRCVWAEMRDGYILAKFEIEENEERNENSSISESELECRIDPNIFAGEWLEHQPTTPRQKETLSLYQEAKAKGRLHAFTCMTVDPSVKDSCNYPVADLFHDINVDFGFNNGVGMLALD